MEPRSAPWYPRVDPVPPPSAGVISSPDLSAGIDLGLLDVAAVLLVLQAGLGLVSAAGVVFLAVLSGGAPLYLLASLVSLVVPVLAIVLARGLTRGRRWARNGSVAYEVLVLLNAAVRFVFLHEVAFGLLGSITGLVLPLVVCVLVLSPNARRAVVHTRRARNPATPSPDRSHLLTA